VAFTQKIIEVDFSLAQGNFQGGGNSHTASGMRITADIVKAGGASMGAAQVSIYGLPLSVMNQLSTYGMTLTLTGKNSITVKAGDDASQLTTVFQGTIASAAMDGQAQPNVAFHVEAYASAFENAKPVEPTSMPGSQDVSTLMSTIAQKAGLQFENNGVDGKIMNPYLPGTAVQQMHALAEAARIERVIDCGTLAIWKPGQSRQGGGGTVSTTYSPQTGLVAYPTFNSQGVVFRALWDPGIQYGSKITIQSSMTPACGEWVIYKLEYALSCLTPNGPWFCDVWAARPGQQPVA
jgi:hypothetical protein